MSIAVAFNAAYVASGVKDETSPFMSAATPAACDAAAEVPKKFGKPVESESFPPKNVVSTPSGAVMSGCWRTSGMASRLPAVSKRMGVPPADENVSMSGGFWPKLGVSW